LITVIGIRIKEGMKTHITHVQQKGQIMVWKHYVFFLIAGTSHESRQKALIAELVHTVESRAC